ncbi:ABC-2 transporter permease [Staphylococcus sp. Marseille-Q6910]|uniref:ABC-2 transporter permease n=1 Tax=Staphylococcus sp. Marseille-Q6910 TaxID=2937990 RepID=UPI00203CA79F|nr:ABC-2 transporter permease [Staphylococcus sp. Marseille-Q6910]
MKGLMLSSFYTSKKSLYTNFVIGVIASILFAFINPYMCCFLPMVFLISPVTDNIKHEKDSKWMYYISTLPTGRSLYVKGYYAYFGVLILVGLILGSIISLIFTQSFKVMLVTALIGIGAAGVYTIIFPLTFKFGPENSNVIMIAVAIIMLLIYFVFYFGIILPNIIKSDFSYTTAAEIPSTFIGAGIFGVFGLISIVGSYLLSLNVFKKQDL